MNTNSKFTFDQQIFLRSLVDDLSSISTMSGTYRISRRIRSLVYSDNGLREASTTIKFGMANAANGLIECIERYRKEFNSTGKSLIEDYFSMKKTIADFSEERELKWYTSYEPVNDIIRNIRGIIKTCDNINEFTQLAYRVDSLPETKFAKASANSIVEFESQFGGCIPCDCEDFNKIISNDEKINSPEYGKNICKRVKALKSEILSIANKYFGKNSKLSEFNIMDKII